MIPLHGDLDLRRSWILMHSTQSYHISDTPFIWCRLLGIRNTIGSCWLRMHVAQTLLWWHQRSSSLKFAIVCSSCHFFSHVIFIQMISVSFYLMSISIVYVTTILNNQLNYFRSADQENVKKKTNKYNSNQICINSGLKKSVCIRQEAGEKRR